MAEKSATYNLRTAYHTLMNGYVSVGTMAIPAYKFKGYGNDAIRIEIIRITEVKPPDESDPCDEFVKICDTEIDIVVNLTRLRASEQLVDDIANAVMQVLVPSLGYQMTVTGFSNDVHLFLSSEEITETFENVVYLHRILTFRDRLTQT